MEEVIIDDPIMNGGHYTDIEADFQNLYFLKTTYLTEEQNMMIDLQEDGMTRRNQTTRSTL